MALSKYTVIKDTREKQGWDFLPSQHCLGMEVRKLRVGDYSLVGLEDVLSIERKGIITEWAHNITEDRFYEELERLSALRYSFILLEFDMHDLMNYPFSSGVPKYLYKKIKMRGSYLLRKTMEIQVKYSIPIIFCGSYGKEVAISLFKRVLNVTNV